MDMCVPSEQIFLDAQLSTTVPQEQKFTEEPRIFFRCQWPKWTTNTDNPRVPSFVCKDYFLLLSRGIQE